MKILLIAVPLMDRIDGELIPIAMDRIRSSPPLGVYWLAGVLRERNYQVEVLDLIALGQIDEALILKKAASSNLVGVSSNSLNWPTARLVVNKIKMEYPDLPVVLGGIHPTQYAEHVFASSATDFIIRGEGEVPLLKLVEALNAKNRRPALNEIPGLCWRDREGINIQPSAEQMTIPYLEELPIPAYDQLPQGVYETLSIESSRGCKYSCAFCATKFRGSWRGVSAECFVDRIERILPYLNRSRFSILSFIDDLYTLDIERVIRITQLIEARKINVQATIDARATDIVRPGVIDSLIPITNHMLIGAECGYDAGLKRINKYCSISTLEKAASMLHSSGLAPNSVFSFVIGFPFENRDDCLRTIEFASNLMLKYNVRIYLQWFNTIPGSALWDDLVTQGLLDISMYDDFGFFTNKHLFQAGVKLSTAEIIELSEIIRNLNKVMLFANPNHDLLQFAPPEWILEETGA
ncbi:MAG: radical SAM protein [Clostridiaceae bacterium]|jgi:anaerobic magnesium-protoporphyrin IX monomethyl ester cyclase|nr:radical SAM protein [Clostridiaceae bacterium]